MSGLISELAPKAKLRGDMQGGLFTAISGVGQSIVYGLIAFSPLGSLGIAYGIHAGLMAAVIGGMLGFIFGNSPVQFGGPRSSTALVTAASLAVFLQSAPILAFGTSALSMTLLLICCQVFLAGVWVVLLSQLGIGKLVYFLPTAVLIGLNVALGVLSIAKLFSACLGYQVYNGPATPFFMPEGLSIPTTVVSIITIACFVYFRSVRRDHRAAMFATFAGLASFFMFSSVYPSGWGPHFEIQAQFLFNADSIHLLANIPQLLLEHNQLLIQLGVGSLVTALLIILESMTSCLAIDQRLGSQHNPAKELRAVGIANLLCGLIGASPSSNFIARAQPAAEMGARSRTSEIIYAFALGIMLFWLGGHLPELPMAVFACIVAASSAYLIDEHAIRMIKHTFGRRDKQNERFNGWIVLTMLAAGAVSNLLVSVVIGVVFTATYFLRRQSTGGLRSIVMAPANRSRRVRPTEETWELDNAFKHVAWIRFEGSLFFGNAHHIELELERQCKQMQLAILDFRLVVDADDTALQSLGRSLDKHKANEKNFCGVLVQPITRLANSQGTGTEHSLKKFAQHHQLELFSNIDQALEAVENTLLTTISSDGGDNIQALAQCDLAFELNAEQLELFNSVLIEQKLNAGDILFHQGDVGNGLYILRQGMVSIILNKHSNNPVRLMTFSSGVTFGEMALIDQQARSATAVADSAASVWHLPIDAFHTLQTTAPNLAQKLLMNMSRALSTRLRTTNASLAAEQ